MDLHSQGLRLEVHHAVLDGLRQRSVEYSAQFHFRLWKHGIWLKFSIGRAVTTATIHSTVTATKITVLFTYTSFD
jgi:hypothetical protein